MYRIFGMSALAALLFTATAHAGSETLLYSFDGYDDGGGPVAGMKQINGLLYGTTEYGGAGNCYSNWLSGCGVVFSFDPQTNQENIIYKFNGDSDGGYPYSRLKYQNGILYGTTYEGGGSENCYDGHNFGCGAVFSIDLSTGKETVLHVFTRSGTDGAEPMAALGALKPDDRQLFGTTAYGGTGACVALGCGTVFKIDLATGAFSTVYSFQSDGADAVYPTHGWTMYGGKLYSTTYAGGAYAYGTLFSIDPKSGAETVLHSFGSGADGKEPYDAMTKIGNTFYGTTFIGGTSGVGTVYSFDPSTGKEVVVYSFQSGGSDSEEPVTDLIHWKGVLYGLAAKGGANDYGTAFSFDPKTGIETVLCSNYEGANDPYENIRLVQMNGALYATASEGGNTGKGAIFSITP